MRATVVANWLVNSDLSLGTGSNLARGLVKHNGLELVLGIIADCLNYSLETPNDYEGSPAYVCLAAMITLAIFSWVDERSTASHDGDFCPSSRWSCLAASTVACLGGQ